MLFGFSPRLGGRYRRALATGRRAERYAMERELKDAAKLRRWTDEQINSILALLQEHAGYLYAHGHALALAQHVFQQACLKLDPASAPAFFAEVLNNGGSAHYGLGAAVEEARQWGVLHPAAVRQPQLRPVTRSSIPTRSSSSPAPRRRARISGGIRVPLTAIRGLGAETVRHILQMRAVFGPFTSLLDFLRRMEPHQISRRELQVLIRLGAFSFTGRSRAQLALVEEIYASIGELLRATDRDPADVGPLEDELPGRCSPRTPASSSGRRSGSPRTSSPTSAFTSCHATSSRTRCASPRSSRRSTSLPWPVSPTTRWWRSPAWSRRCGSARRRRASRWPG